MGGLTELTQILSDVADSIRSKTGITEEIAADDFPSIINNLSMNFDITNAVIFPDSCPITNAIDIGFNDNINYFYYGKNISDLGRYGIMFDLNYSNLNDLTIIIQNGTNFIRPILNGAVGTLPKETNIFLCSGNLVTNNVALLQYQKSDTNKVSIYIHENSFNNIYNAFAWNRSGYIKDFVKLDNNDGYYSPSHNLYLYTSNRQKGV